jgi:hypothetical protein
LAENKRERQFLEDSLRRAKAMYGAGAGERAPASSRPKPRRKKARIEDDSTGSLFGPQPGGPTETLLAVIGEKPGLTLPALLDIAERRARMTAANKRGSLRETVRALIRKGRVFKDPTGGHHLR